MTIDKAIEILTNEQKDHHSFPTDIIGKAELLSIEALKRIKNNRIRYLIGKDVPLPGETPE